MKDLFTATKLVLALLVLVMGVVLSPFCLSTTYYSTTICGKFASKSSHTPSGSTASSSRYLASYKNLTISGCYSSRISIALITFLAIFLLSDTPATLASILAYTFATFCQTSSESISGVIPFSSTFLRPAAHPLSISLPWPIYLRIESTEAIAMSAGDVQKVSSRER